MVNNMSGRFERKNKEKEVGKAVLGALVGGLVLPALMGAALTLGALAFPTAVLGAIVGVVVVEYSGWKK